jgi:hypothetical protein
MLDFSIIVGAPGADQQTFGLFHFGAGCSTG